MLGVDAGGESRPERPEAGGTALARTLRGAESMCSLSSRPAFAHDVVVVHDADIKRCGAGLQTGGASYDPSYGLLSPVVRSP